MNHIASQATTLLGNTVRNTSLLDLHIPIVENNINQAFDNGNNLGHNVKTGVWILVCLAASFLAVSMYFRLTQRAQRLQWDDWVLVAAWLALLAQGVFTHVAVDFGFGRHAAAVDTSMLPGLAVTGLVSVTFALAGAAWSKTAFAMTMLRFTGGGRVRTMILVNIVLINASLGVGVVLLWVQCSPAGMGWKPVTAQVCVDPRVNVVIGIVLGAYSGIMDLVLAILPWVLLKDVQMRQEEKIGVSLVMSLGIFAAVAAFTKCTFIPTLAEGDFSYNGTQLVVWIAVEVAVFIMAASIPVMRPLLRNFVKSRRSGSEQAKTSARQPLQSQFDFDAGPKVLTKTPPPQYELRRIEEGHNLPNLLRS